MSIQFTIDGQIDPVAAYAACVSTVLGIWETFKWRRRHAVGLTVNANMLFVPSSDKNSYVIANVTNLGETPTTITHFFGYSWDSEIQRFMRRKKMKAFIVNAPNVPHVLSPGEQWTGQAIQNEEIEKLATEGVLYMGIIHSMAKKPAMRKVQIASSKTKKSSK